MRRLVLQAMLIALFPVLAHSTETSYEQMAKRAAFLYARIIITEYDLVYYRDNTEKWFHCENTIVYKVDIRVKRDSVEKNRTIYCEYEKDTNRYKVIVTNGSNPFLCGGDSE